MRRELTAAAAAFAVGLGAFAFARTRAVEAPAGPARRVISLSPSITEMIFALGAGDRVVGVSAGVAWPPEALLVERVGGYLDADLERVVGLRPDLLLIQGLHTYVHDQAAELGIRVRRVRMARLDDIRRAAREIGGALAMPDAGEALVRGLDRELDAVRTRTRTRRPLRTFVHIAHGPAPPKPPLATTGGGTFLTEVLEIAGGENVYSDLARPYLEVSAESLIERAPEVVMVSAPGARLSSGDAEAVRAAWRGLLDTRGRSLRVVFLTADCAQVPGPRVGTLAREIERLLWPERAKPQGGPVVLPRHTSFTAKTPRAPRTTTTSQRLVSPLATTPCPPVSLASSLPALGAPGERAMGEQWGGGSGSLGGRPAGFPEIGHTLPASPVHGAAKPAERHAPGQEGTR